MGWEFAAVWGIDPAKGWRWTWRRIADDSGEVLANSGAFLRLDDCIQDARRNGFDDADCAPAE